jgi:hypothetical protein
MSPSSLVRVDVPSRVLMEGGECTGNGCHEFTRLVYWAGKNQDWE